MNITAYDVIKDFYGDRVANRSQVPLINHINEGIEILHLVGADDATIDAFCLHPIIQGDPDFENNREYFFGLPFSNKVISLTVEYRNIANQYLSKRTISDISEIKLSPVPEVNQMLIADKVQNYKDFLLYHNNTHPRSAELNEYFKNWLKKLDAEHVFRTYTELV